MYLFIGVTIIIHNQYNTNFLAMDPKSRMSAKCCYRSLPLCIIDFIWQERNFFTVLLHLVPQTYPLFLSSARVWDRFLEQTPFWILPWGCPLFQVRHTQFEFPAIFMWKLQKGLYCCLPGSNPGPSSCEASMLPQDHQVWYKLSGKIQQYNHMWREIQIEYVEFEERGIPMVKFLFWMFNLAVPISSTSKALLSVGHRLDIISHGPIEVNRYFLQRYGKLSFSLGHFLCITFIVKYYDVSIVDNSIQYSFNCFEMNLFCSPVSNTSIHSNLGMYLGRGLPIQLRSQWCQHQSPPITIMYW